jgi:hypothetical protein
LLKKLESGVKIRFLIFNPRSSHLDDLASDFAQSPAELRSECDKGVQSILELGKLWNQKTRAASSPGELEIRVFDLHPHARFYVFDPDSKSGRTFFVPYINELNSPEIPGFLLENVDTGVFGPYIGGIRKLWADSQSFEVFLKQHPEVSPSEPGPTKQ